jgi:hypothetical protein
MLISGWAEKGGTGEEQSQEHACHFLWHQEDCTQKNSSWQAKQSISHTTVKMCEDFIPNFGDK